MKARLKKKIWNNLDNPKLHYSVNHVLIATKGLFLTPIHFPNGYRYYMSHYFGKITKYDKDLNKITR